ncbi:transposable element Tcb1 transposase [Trichonephila clavipes]|nr:transposable element Tcb1 transposase [Trichonephila clavipes]
MITIVFVRGSLVVNASIHTTPTVGVMVWCVMAYNARSPLILIHGTMTAQRDVHDILQPHELTQQGCHKTTSATLPPSPGLTDPQICHQSSISGIILGWQVRQPSSLVELEVRLHQLWNDMSQDIIRNLHASMPARIALCIRDRGGPTQY